MVTLKVQLQKALKEKMEAHLENLNLVKMCKDSEENNLKSLEKLQELNSKLIKKTLEFKDCKLENEELRQEIKLLNKLFTNVLQFP